MDSFIVQPIPRRPYAIPLPSPITSVSSPLLSDPVVDAVARISIADSHAPSQDDPKPFSLSDDALEEFLGILRPAFPPRSTSSASSTSPSIRTASYSRPHPYRSGRPPPGSASSADDVLIRSRKSSAKECRKHLNMSVDTSIVLGDLVDDPAHPSSGHTKAWRASRSIRSPISRMHTRNPFPRHPSCEALSQQQQQQQQQHNLLPHPNQLSLTIRSSSATTVDDYASPSSSSPSPPPPASTSPSSATTVMAIPICTSPSTIPTPTTP